MKKSSESKGNSRDFSGLQESFDLSIPYVWKPKLPIGMEGESGYYADGICASYIYDYDNEYMEDG